MVERGYRLLENEALVLGLCGTFGFAWDLTVEDVVFVLSVRDNVSVQVGCLSLAQHCSSFF